MAETLLSARSRTQTRHRPRRSPLLNRIRYFVNHQEITHEIIVITVSYCFIAAGAWNDSLLGFAPSTFSRSSEFLMAAVLGLEVLTRLIFTKKRPLSFWLLLLLDIVSVLTIVQAFFAIGFLRVFRLLYASMRLGVLLDRLARRYQNPGYLIGMFPLVVPLLAAVVFAIERRTTGSPIHNYVDALAVCFTFSLTPGNVRPASAWAMGICGALFLAGLLSIGICTNAISMRYIRSR